MQQMIMMLFGVFVYHRKWSSDTVSGEGRCLCHSSLSCGPVGHGDMSQSRVCCICIQGSLSSPFLSVHLFFNWIFIFKNWYKADPMNEKWKFYALGPNTTLWIGVLCLFMGIFNWIHPFSCREGIYRLVTTDRLSVISWSVATTV